MDVLVLIDKLDDLVHNAKAVPLTDQVRIDREEIYDILDQMRATIPEEIKQARWIVKERQEMLAEAKRESDRILGEAREQAVREASQTEIVKLAERQAQEIVEDARRQARETRLEMEDWADSILSTLEVNLDKFLGAVRRGRERLHERSQESVMAGIVLERRLDARGAGYSLVLGAASARPSALRWTHDQLRPAHGAGSAPASSFATLEVELEPFELGGQRYIPVPEKPEADADAHPAELRAPASSSSSTPRLARAVLALPRRRGARASSVAREYQATSPGEPTSSRRRTSSTTARPLGVGARRRRAGAAGQDPLPRRTAPGSARCAART